MSSTKSNHDPQTMFQLKGGLYTLTAIQILNTQLNQLAEQLDSKIAQAPKFFLNAPVVIDLQKVNRSSQKIDFNQLKEILLSKTLVPVGVRGGNTEQHSAATQAGFALLQDGNKDREILGPNPEILEAGKEAGATLKVKLETEGSNTKVITEPVRSGQQIYVREGDLIVLAPVSHGAELLADGHIHVYGPLRGRALAGVTGDTRAHIFCQSLEAELVSIAGQYKISEDIEQSAWRQSVDIALIAGRLHIKPI